MFYRDFYYQFVMAIASLETLLTAKVPLWQVVLVGSTTLFASRLLCRHLRQLHTTPALSKASKRNKVVKTTRGTALGEDIKLVLIIRTDLGMSKGKVAAQCSHATLACYKDARKRAAELVKLWELMGQTKVTLKCSSEEEMLQMERKARGCGLIAQSICDAGRTQIAAGSRTVLGIGPGPASLIDKVSGHLQLY
ncbi:peptidyl-tRNA hydrolase PTH2-domain-containing protein [Coemansia mojavensis]|nr:peptidyl-tRNA hydrolase PTH2-domain-containing protein [Coemansia mojavensis]